ncbi:MAG: hypothetical protein ACYTGX_06395 [Planctomycetota bacterium]|jgi:hypothetical protein
MLGWLRGAAVLGFGVFTGATLFLFPATLVGFARFPDDPQLAGELAGLQFQAYGPVAWISLGVGVAASGLAALQASRVRVALVSSALALVFLFGWLVVLRPLIDRLGEERRTLPTAAERATADAGFKQWHGVSMVLALAALLAGGAATIGAVRFEPKG